MSSALVLFSGGLDSTTALYWAGKKFGHNVIALTFDYGQRHRLEVQMASRICQNLKIPQIIHRIDLTQIGGSSLTDLSLPLPEHKNIGRTKKKLPSTYVPFRNGIFLSLAAAWAEVKEVHNLVCGFNTIDSPDYPDTRLEFVKAMESALNQGTSFSISKKRIKIHAPLIKMKKSQIIETGLSLGADYSFSISCYAGKEIPCFSCSSCRHRQKAWDETGKEDHLLIRLKKEGKI